MKKAHHFSRMETLTNQRQHLKLKMETPYDTENGDSCQKERPSQYQGSDQTDESSKNGVFSFHTNPVDACEKGLSFHTENSASPTVCILDLDCTRAMGPRKAVAAFCRYVGSHPNSGLWYEIHPTSSSFFFANSQQSKCTEKIVIFMYDHGWNSQFTEFDIAEEGDVPLLMSLPQMRNLGFQFELTPDKASLSCARIGMRKMVLKTAISTHLILDLQDVAWYMSQVNFKTPQVKSFFSKHDHYEYSQIAVQQDQQDEEALVTGDYWHVDGLRRELIRHHKDKRQYVHEMQRSETTPIPKDQLWDEGERLTLSTRRVGRRFFTRTTGVLRRRGFLTRWKNSGRARRSTRSRRTT